MDYKELAGLVEQAKRGNAEAYEGIYHNLYQKVYYIAYNIAKNEQDADDVVQETFVKLFQNLQTIKNAQALVAYVNQITYHTAIDMKRRQGKAVLVDELEEYTHGILEEKEDFLPEEYLESKEKRQHVLDAISQLKDTYRITILLFYYDGLSMKEIAKLMGTTKKAVSMRLSRARAILKEKLTLYQSTGSVVALMITNKNVLTKILQDDAASMVHQRAEVKLTGWEKIADKITPDPSHYGAAGQAAKAAVGVSKMIIIAPLFVGVVTAVLIAGASMHPPIVPNQPLVQKQEPAKLALERGSGQEEEKVTPGIPPNTGLTIDKPDGVNENAIPEQTIEAGESGVPSQEESEATTSEDSPDDMAAESPWVPTTTLTIRLTNPVLTYQVGTRPSPAEITKALDIHIGGEIAEVKLGMLSMIDFDTEGDYSVQVYVTDKKQERYPYRVATIHIGH